MNNTCKGMNFIHLTYVMLLHYLVVVKVKKNENACELELSISTIK